MEVLLVLLLELLISLIPRVFLDTLRSKISQLEETLMKFLDLFKHSNTLMNSEKSAHLDGNQEVKPWFQMLILPKQKNSSRDNDRTIAENIKFNSP